ncbi:MAG: hypothetical protein HKN85_03760 [Gammaproteobacteria bacterium]|nr:hypothetical protein [Gammaproteobacteria bacterium]
MSGQRTICPDCFYAAETGRQGHFIVGPVQTTMTQLANPDAVVELITAKLFLKSTAPMQFARNQMMKSQITHLIAELAVFGVGHFNVQCPQQIPAFNFSVFMCDVPVTPVSIRASMFFGS